MSGDEAEIDLRNEEGSEEIIKDWGSINRQNETIGFSYDGMNHNDESLPKRSEKFFDQDGSEFQTLKLGDAREQMFLALLHIRGHHVKQLLIGVWVQSQRKAFIPHAKGSFFKDMGIAHTYSHKKRLQGAWLSGLEAVYLVERGSLVMYLADDKFLSFIENDTVEFDYGSLVALSLSHLYSVVFNGNSELLDKYKVYALLKRLGYLVMEHSQVNFKDEIKTFPQEHKPEQQSSLRFRLKSFFVCLGTTGRRLGGAFFRPRGHFLNYTLVFKLLSFSSPSNFLEELKPAAAVDTRYRIVFHVWKPTAGFSKKNPPSPDFRLGILNTSSVVFPDLAVIQKSCEPPSQSKSCEVRAGKASEMAKVAKTSVHEAKQKKKLSSTKNDIRLQQKAKREAGLNPKLRDRNNYLKAKDKLLKQGSTGRSIIYAIIDNGIVNFTVYNETDFRLGSSAIELDKLERRGEHGIVWNEKLRL